MIEKKCFIMQCLFRMLSVSVTLTSTVSLVYVN